LLGSGKRVLLSFSGEPLRLGADQLRDFWNGDFIAVWRLPEHVPAKLRVGDAGPGVAWVQAQVSRMDGAKPADAGPAYFDATLEERIRKLQVAYGIRPDGIVGQENAVRVVRSRPEWTASGARCRLVYILIFETCP
jgi:general secretion pathway protein A